MTQFDDLFAEYGMPAMLHEFGEEVVYRKTGETPKTVTVMVDRNVEARFTPEVGFERDILMVTFKNNDVTGITEPERGDTIDVTDVGTQQIVTYKATGNAKDATGALWVLEYERVK